MSHLEDRVGAIKERISIQEILSEWGFTPARQSGGTLTYHCPNPDHPDNNPSFTVKNGQCKCWSQCDWSGDLIDLVAWREGCSKGEAIEKLAERVGLGRDERPRGATSSSTRSSSRPSSSSTALSPEKARHLLEQFVAERRWHPQAVAEMGLHVVLDDLGRPRVRFPYLLGEEMVAYQDRAIGNAKWKWLTPAGTRLSIFNANALGLAWDRDREVWVTEGPADAMALISTFTAPVVVGIPGAGSFKPEWAQAFAGLRQVVLIGDNDPPGEKFRARCRAFLAPVVGRVIDLRVPEPHHDLDDWRRASGTSEPELFGIPLLEAAERAEGRLEVVA